MKRPTTHATRAGFRLARSGPQTAIALSVVLGLCAARPSHRSPDEPALAHVDSLRALHLDLEADSLVRGRLLAANLATFADSIELLPWLVRHYELLPQIGTVGAAESTDVSGARRLADVLEPRVASGDPLAARALVASARLDQPDGRTLLFARRHEWIVLDRANGKPGPDSRSLWNARLLLFRVHSSRTELDSARADLNMLDSMVSRPWAGIEDRAVQQGMTASFRWKARPEVALRQVDSALVVLDACRLPVDSDVQGLHISRAALLSLLGYPSESLAELERTARALERASQTQDFTYALLLEQICARQRRLGRLAEARESGERALEAMRRTVGAGHEDHAFAGWVLGLALRDLGDLPGAMLLTEHAVDVFSARLGPTHLRVAEALNSLGILQRRMGHPDSARRSFERAMSIQLPRLPTDDPDVQITRSNLANVNGELGDPARALAVGDSALRYIVATRGTDHPVALSALAIPATAYRALGDTAHARPLFDSLVTRRLRKYGPLHPEVTDALCERAFARALAGHRSGAVGDGLLADTLRRRQRRILLRGLDERSALAVLARPEWGGLDLALSELVVGRTDDDETIRVYDAVIRDRALVLDEMLERRRNTASTSSDSVRFRELARIRAEMARRLLSGDEKSASVLDSLARREAALAPALNHPRGGAENDRDPSDGVGLAEVRAALPSDGTLLSFVRYDRLALGSGAPRWAPARTAQYAAFVMRANDARVHMVAIGNAGELDALIDRWLVASRDAGKRDESGFRDREGVALRSRLLDKVLPYLRGAAKVFVVPDGAIALCDIGTLPAPEGGFLLERPARWFRLSSERELLQQTGSSSSSARGLLAVGGADFDDHAAPRRADDRLVSTSERLTTCENLRARRFAPLPGTRAEAERVCSLWRGASRDTLGGAQLLEAGSAREREVRALAPGKRVVHLATHGFALRDDCDAWSLAGSAMFRSLYRSGLALAGANARDTLQAADDDGLLTAGEISTLDLTDTDWVCLSACESGLGESVRGEGLLGLERALRIAGVRQVVMSLRAVGDETAARWNDIFYTAVLRKGESTNEAARTASLELLRERRSAHLSVSPDSWACFVVTGIPWRALAAGSTHLRESRSP